MVLELDLSSWTRSRAKGVRRRGPSDKHPLRRPRPGVTCSRHGSDVFDIHGTAETHRAVGGKSDPRG